MVRSLIWRWGPVLAWVGLIFALSSVQQLAVSKGLSDLLLRKGAHMVEYAVLFLLLYRALTLGRGWQLDWRLAGWAAMAAVAYAVTDELHQHFVPTRVGNGWDVLIDAVGVGLGVGMRYWWSWWKEATG